MLDQMQGRAVCRFAQRHMGGLREGRRALGHPDGSEQFAPGADRDGEARTDLPFRIFEVHDLIAVQQLSEHSGLLKSLDPVVGYTVPKDGLLPR